MGPSAIRKKYRNEWVLVEYSKLDKNLQAKAGKVLAHSPSKEEIYKALLRTRGKNISVEYCGKMPEDMVVVFCLDATQELRQQPAQALADKLGPVEALRFLCLLPYALLHPLSFPGGRTGYQPVSWTAITELN